jgi:hypothetical protein
MAHAEDPPEEADPPEAAPTEAVPPEDPAGDPGAPVTPPEAEAADAPAAEAADDGWTTLPPAKGDFGSALDPLVAPADRPAAPPPSPTAGPSSPPPEPPRAQTRGRVGVRPRIALAGIADDDSGVLLGGTLTHSWWRLSGTAVRPSGATRLDLGGRVGGARGIDTRLVSVHGVWFGPVGLLGGGAVRWDRLETEAGGLARGLTAGPQGRAVLRLGKLVPWAAYTWAPVVTGPRLDPQAAATPVEQTWDFGLDRESHPLGLRLSGAIRDTPSAQAWEAGLGLHVQL